MREAIEKTEAMGNGSSVVNEARRLDKTENTVSAVAKPVEEQKAAPIVEKSKVGEQESQKKVEKTPPKPSIIDLANNSDFSVATIEKEANRINRKDEGEVFISLH